MTMHEVAKKLVSLCREGRNDEAMRTLYDQDIVSVEAAAPPGQQRESIGIGACEAKGKQWSSMHEIHGHQVEGPFPHGDDKFAVVFRYDISQKQGGKRLNMDEIAVYTVKNGKIVREEFYYATGQ